MVMRTLARNFVFDAFVLDRASQPKDASRRSCKKNEKTKKHAIHKEKKKTIDRISIHTAAEKKASTETNPPKKPLRVLDPLTCKLLT